VSHMGGNSIIMLSNHYISVVNPGAKVLLRLVVPSTDCISGDDVEKCNTETFGRTCIASARCVYHGFSGGIRFNCHNVLHSLLIGFRVALLNPCKPKDTLLTGREIFYGHERAVLANG
jgi:hypothetical protein